jgi:hypothetical protein
MFDFEWTGQDYGNENDRDRGIAAAVKYCTELGIDAASAYDATLWHNDEEPEQAALDLWSAIECEAVSTMCEGWHTEPENVSLIWRQQ